MSVGGSGGNMNVSIKIYRSVYAIDYQQFCVFVLYHHKIVDLSMNDMFSVCLYVYQPYLWIGVLGTETTISENTLHLEVHNHSPS